MRTVPVRFISVLSACLASFALLECNAVLGIEQAELDPTFGDTGNGGTAGTSGAGSGGTVSGKGGTSGTGGRTKVTLPVAGCIDRKDECAACLTTCTSFDLAACLDDKVCRNAVDDYRACLGNLCDQQENCREELFAVSDPLVDSLVMCLADSCLTPCEGSTLVRMCELYCACMKDNCPTKPIAMAADCVSSCLADPATADGNIAYCRKYHCEFIDTTGANPATHCEHAVGQLEECESPIAPMPQCDGDEVISGFPCLEDAECCSGVCEGETCR
jgi:hypothetical protein